MPSIQDYAAVVPFNRVDELVSAANSVLRAKPRLQVTARMVRYYTSPEVGILPKPAGTPKFPRYEMEHLARLVAARCLLESGESLQVAKDRLDRLFELGIVPAMAEAQRLVERYSQDKVYETFERRQPVQMSLARILPQDWVACERLQLAPGITLEVASGLDREEALTTAIEKLKEISDSY